MFQTSTRGPSRTPALLPASRWRNEDSRKQHWVVCMFSPTEAHIAVCDPEHLLGPEAVIRVADCARVIVKALRQGKTPRPSAPSPP